MLYQGLWIGMPRSFLRVCGHAPWENVKFCKPLVVILSVNVPIKYTKYCLGHANCKVKTLWLHASTVNLESNSPQIENEPDEH